MRPFQLKCANQLKKEKRSNESFVDEFLKSVKRDYELIDKHTDSFINKTIAKISDEEKEQNLKFIEDLDKETRASFKVMLMTGRFLKHAAAKDKSLYFAEQIPEDIVYLKNQNLIDEIVLLSNLGVSAENLTDEQFLGEGTS